MTDQYFGTKELYEVVLRARTPMYFGSRYIEADEPILYFENINLATLKERTSIIMARGGWDNLPRVVWQDRSEVEFVLSEGVMSSVGMGILMSAQVLEKVGNQGVLIPKREGPFSFDIGEEIPKIVLEKNPYAKDTGRLLKKIFIFEFENDAIQNKVYGKRVADVADPFGDAAHVCLEVYTDKDCTIPADTGKQYIVDYYYKYESEALVYLVQKERFNGIFSLEGKFYSKDENEGINHTNLLYMPRVRIMSDISLRLGERADPTMSTFHIIGLPETIDNDRKNVVVEITRLDEDIDGK